MRMGHLTETEILKQAKYVGPFVREAPDMETALAEAGRFVPGALVSWNDEGYLELEKVLNLAYKRASRGKGSERHASGEPFNFQPICSELRALESITPALFQARKKLLESLRLPPDMAINELLDAINYIAAAVIVTQEGE